MEMHRACGDLYGLEFPADGDTLVEDGVDFLTRAFHASGAMPPNNKVARIVHAEEFFGGGTGRKMTLDIEYELPQADLPSQLFIKFSRNFEDELRDSAKFMMVSESKLAALSRTPGFPVTVPNCLFADVESQTATGLLITERIDFGKNGTEPLFPKCMDYTINGSLAYYKAIVKALAKLSGTHKAGRLSPQFDEHFPFQPEQAGMAFSMLSTEEKLLNRATRMFDFINRYPQLFPENILEGAFQQQFTRDIPDVVAAAEKIKAIMVENSDLIALCHWNANIDNCWFWRDGNGDLQCGLMDWAMVGQMSVAQSIHGAISGAEIAIWDEHLDELINVFIEEYAKNGAPRLELEEVRRQMLLLLAVAGVSFFMSAPVAIMREIENLDNVASYQDACFQKHENARIQLHMMTKMLNVWEKQKLGDLVRQLAG